MGKRRWSLSKLLNLKKRPLYTDYKLEKPYVWIDVKNLAVRIKKDDEGVVVDVFQTGDEMAEPIASTWALYTEGMTDEEDNQ